MFAPHALAQSRDDGFLAVLGELGDASFLDKEHIVERLSRSGHPSTRAVLTAFLEDRLYSRAKDHKIFIVKSTDDTLASVDLVDPASLQDAGSGAHDELTRIGTNNRLRKLLKTTVARFDLASPNPAVKLAAVQEMLRDLDQASITLLRERVGVETDAAVKEEIETGLALAALDSGEPRARLDAVATLARRLRPQVRNRLAGVLEKGADGNFVEPDEKVRQAAAAAVRRIDRSRALYAGVETLFFGLSVGSVLVLVAIGLAITFGVMGVINMAHGELMMLGAYTTYVVQLAMPRHIGLSILVATPAAFLVAGLAGVIVERTIIRFLYGRPLETLLATFGVSLVLQQSVRSLFSANNRSVETPAWMSGTLQLNDALAITFNRLYIVIFTLIVFAILLVEANAAWARHPRGLSEQGDGAGDGHSHRLGGRHDLRPGVGHCRYRRRGAQSVYERRPQSRPGVYHRLVHGGRVRRRRESLGHARRRHVHGGRQPVARALRGRGAREDLRARRLDPVHPTVASRPVSPDRTRGGEPVALCARGAYTRSW